ncbi:MAG: alpha/beta hydrolase [Lachnospiraceae bacterium]|nr:alpha/beta hydrolase [Lachnospiraceae bacterium]
MDKGRREGAVRIQDTEMYYVSFGKEKKNLVVLPGLSDGLATVKGKGMFLSAPYKRFMEDHTVYMFSRKNLMPDGYTIRQMAADQAYALKELGIEKTAVLGVSQGGMISQYLAIDYPDMVEKLILAVTSPWANEVVKGVVGGWIEMAKKKNYVTLMVDTADKMYSDAYLAKNRKLFPLIARLTKPKNNDRFLKNAYAILGFDAREELSKISAPTLIIAGDDDKTVGNAAKNELHSSIAGSELYVYEGLGHGAFEEAKDFYDRVYAFRIK